jgi:hypothetical protein
MFSLLCRAYLELLRLELPLARRNFAGIHERVKRCKPATLLPYGRRDTDVLRAVELACVFYCKEVLCLQRSAATTCLLRKHGVDAEMVIGVQQIPFRAHAWVEIGGRCVTDKPYIPQTYLVLDRC